MTGYEAPAAPKVLLNDRLERCAPKIQRSDLSPDQVVVYDAIIRWSSDPNARQFLSVGGYAGTGKTTVTSAVAAELSERFSIAFCAFTGKAANVLQRKLRDNGLSALPCSTIHSLIYRPKIDEKTGEVVGWERLDEDTFPYGMIVVDEASMLDQDIWNDLLAFEVPILLVGDHGQLPPIGANPGLMRNPDLRLEKIHRQAEGNPILALAQHVREGGNPRRFVPVDDRVAFHKMFPPLAAKLSLNSAAICFRNKVRVQLNTVAREAQGYEGPVPDAGEVVICLQNERKKGVFNGMRGVLLSAEYAALDKYDRFKATIDFIDDERQAYGRLNFHQFNREKTFKNLAEVEAAMKMYPRSPDGSDGFFAPGEWTAPRSRSSTGLLFDFGYVMTCHKAQGSQFQEVTVGVERWLGKTEDDRRRWLYTSVTRASHQLNLVFL